MLDGRLPNDNRHNRLAWWLAYYAYCVKFGGVLFGWLVEQGGYGSVDLGKVDAGKRVAHELGYAVVA